MIEAFEKYALLHPERTAYIATDGNITYGELYSLAKKRADELEKGIPTVLVGDKSIEYLSYILACQLCGIPYVPVDASTPEGRKNEIISALGECLYIDTVTGTREKFCRDGNFISDNCVYVIFTSGSTGKPKGVPITKDNIESFYKWISNLEPLSDYSECAVMNQASFSFDLSVADMVYALGNGHTLIGADKAMRDNIGLWLEALRSHRARVCVVTPTFIRMCLLDKSFTRENYPKLDTVYFCGERLDKALVKKLFDRFADIKIINAYGPTEATSAVSAALITKADLDSDDPLPVGIIGETATRVEIIDGEIVLYGKSVFLGYINADSSACFKYNGENAYRTGDLGYIKASKLYCTGRRDSQIKYSGYRIELGDIEENIKAQKGVIDAAVAILTDENGNVKRLRAHTVLEQGYTADDIRESLKACLPGYMIPQIVACDKLDLNESTKIDRKKISDGN